MSAVAVIEDTPTRAKHAPPPEWLDVKRDDLIAALMQVKPAVPTSSAIEALRGVRVVSDDEGAHVWATDMDVCGWHTVDFIDGSTDGFDALVSHADLVALLKALPKGPVTVEGVPDGSRMGLRLTAGKRTVDLPGLDGEHHPADPPVTFPAVRRRAVVDAESLADSLVRTLPHASADESKPILTGVLIDFADGMLAATDSYRMAKVPCPFEKTHENASPALAPARMLKAALRALKGAEIAVIGVTDTHVIVDCGEAIWSARLIDGQYPALDRLIPDFDDHVDVAAGDLIDSIAACRAVLKKNAPVRLTVRPGRPGKLIVAGYTPDGPSITDELVLEQARWGMDEVTFGMNPDFFADSLATIGSDVVRLTMGGAKRPVLVTDPHEPGVICLNMPIGLTD